MGGSGKENYDIPYKNNRYYLNGGENTFKISNCEIISDRFLIENKI